MREALRRYQEVLGIADFRRLWISWSISRLGDGVHEIALVLLIWQLTGSAALMATVAICSMLPNLALALIGGTWADRHDRKRIMVWCDAARGLLVLSIPALYYTGGLSPIIICAIAFFAGALETFFSPAQFAALLPLVGHERIQSAQALMQMTGRIARIVGPSLGGAIFGLLGVLAPFLMNSASFIASALFLAGIRSALGTGDREGKAIASAMADGLRYIRRTRVLAVLLVMALLLNLGGAPLGIILPFYARALGLETHAYGYMMALISAGMIAGFWYAGGKPVRGRDTILLALMVGAAFGLLPAALLLSAPLAWIIASALLLLLGLLIGNVNVRVSAIMQRVIRDEYRGRVGSVGRMFSLIATPVSLAIFGPLIDAWGPACALLLCAALVILAGIPFIGGCVWKTAFDDPVA